MSESLRPRLHILPETLARSPGHISERFATPIAALNALERQLQPLPAALVAHWLLRPEGHIILNARKHEFEIGPSPDHPRNLVDVAWTRLALSSDPRNFLLPTGPPHHPRARLGPGRWSGTHPEKLGLVCDRGQQRLRAGYGYSPEARSDVIAYLAEGIAAYLTDRRELNLRDPALEKLFARAIVR